MIIQGRLIAEELLNQLKKEVEDKDLKLQLAAVLVGTSPEFKKFVELKGKAAEKIGVSFKMCEFPEDITTQKLKEESAAISARADGVLIELPLPEHINASEVLSSVPVSKDVDVLSDESQELFYENASKIFPPAVEAVRIIIERNGINVKDRTVAVFGQGMLIGKPIAHWLEAAGARVIRIRSKTKDFEEGVKRADIVVSGVGKPGIITGDMLKKGVVAFDFGYEKKDGKMVGDMDGDSVSSVASLFTPVPGGMGPVVIATVLMNLVKLNL